MSEPGGLRWTKSLIGWFYPESQIVVVLPCFIWASIHYWIPSLFYNFNFYVGTGPPYARKVDITCCLLGHSGSNQVTIVE